MPNASAHIPDDSNLWEKIVARARDRYGGKISAYVRALIERDLEGRDVGIPDAAYSELQIKRWMDDEIALLEAARLALRILREESAAERSRIANEMALLILDTTRRAPLAETKSSATSPNRRDQTPISGRTK